MSAFLIAMGWKSALVLAAALAFVALMRGRAPAERGDVLRGAIVLLPLLPIISLVVPRVSIEAPWLVASTIEQFGTTARANELAVFDLNAVIVGLYGVGLVVLSLRMWFGVARLAYWAQRAEPVDAPAWTGALSASGNTRLLVSDDVAGPLSFGWRRPVILIDRMTLQRPEHARAIIAHETAHIARADWLVLMAMHAVAVVFWFNPLVWVAKHIAEQCAEENADACAVRELDAPDYAQALLDCARGARVMAAVGMAQRQFLPRRLHLILEAKPHRARQAWPVAVSGAAIVCLSTLVATTYFVAPPAKASAPVFAHATAPAAPVSAPASAEPVRRDDVAAELTALPVMIAPSGLDSEEVADTNVIEAVASDPMTDEVAPALPPQSIAATESGAPSTAEERRRARWSENARRHLERNARRDARRERRDRAREESAWMRSPSANE